MEALKLENYEYQKENDNQNKEFKHFKVNSLETANWALRKIRSLKLKTEENKLIADKERARINDELNVINEWENTKNFAANDSINYLQNMLKEYLVELRKDNPKAKIDTPFGTVNTKKQSAKYEYKEDEFINWAKENKMTEFIRVKEEINKPAIKSSKYLKEFEGMLINSETGELVSGIKISYPEDEIVVKVVD